MRWQWHVTDFIKEQRALVSLSNQPDAAFLVGAGECAFLITEQLGLHQFGGNRCTVDGNERLFAARAGLMQGFDEHFLADPGFTVDQQGNVFFQQALGLTHGFFHATVAEMQGVEADGSGCGYNRLREYSGLNRCLFRPLQQALEAIASRGLQGEGQAVGLVQQFQQRDLEQAFDTDPRQADAQQIVGPAVGRQHLSGLIEYQQARPLAVEVV